MHVLHVDWVPPLSIHTTLGLSRLQWPDSHHGQATTQPSLPGCQPASQPSQPASPASHRPPAAGGGQRFWMAGQRFWITLAIASMSHGSTAASTAPNILYFVSDDLRPELGAYGGAALTPHMDQLAAEGTVFLNAFCQQAVCGPSRASFMTGRRPHHTRVFGNGGDFRELGLDRAGVRGAQWVSLPQHFRNANYTTLGGGKTFHPTCPPNWDLPLSWSPDRRYYPFAYWIQPNRSVVYTGGACPRGPNSSETCAPCPGPGKPRPTNFSVFASDTWCGLDEPDENFYDHGLATNTISQLRYAADLFHSDRRPFFVMAGFARPHMPQRMPRRFWDLYDRKSIALPKHKLPPEMMPGIAYFQFGFYNSSNGYVYPLHIDQAVPGEATLAMRHAYYASVSWLDFQVGRVLTALEENNIKDTTTVVLPMVTDPLMLLSITLSYSHRSLYCAAAPCAMH